MKKETGKTKIKTTGVMRTATAAFLILAFIVLLCALALKSCGTVKFNGSPGLYTDENAREGGWEKADEQEVKEKLNKSVEEGYINISMNTTPVFDDGNSEGNLMIVNENINRYPQTVIITRNDTGEVIYTSKAIPVGSKIEKAKLSVPLPAGKYECTAMFHNTDPQTGTSLGCAGAVITITVLK